MHFFILNDGNKWITDCYSFRDVINYIQNHIGQNLDVYIHIDNLLYVILSWNLSKLYLLNEVTLKYIGNNYINDIIDIKIEYPIKLDTNLGLIEFKDVQGVLFNDKFYH